MDSRDVALTVLKDIETNDTFSNIALAKALKVNQFSDKKDRAFVTRLVEGTVETRLTLDYIINQFSKTRINKCKNQRIKSLWDNSPLPKTGKTTLAV